MHNINWKIGGVGGMGAMGVGLLFSKTLFRAGYYICDYDEYNSIIKGGHNTYQVRASSEKVSCISKQLNLLLSLDTYSLKYVDALSSDGYVICDWAQVKNKELYNNSLIIDVPFSLINKNNGGDEIMKNIIGLGASIAFLGIDINITKALIAEQFSKKGKEIIEKNNLLLSKGYDYILEKYPEQINKFTNQNGIFTTIPIKDNIYILNGNESICLASIKSGLGYYAAYPMTPSSSILHFLAKLASKYNIIVKHAEDEISAINSAIGASYGGARAMVGTSGGGFSLMVEALGMAAMTEIPLVIAMISRPGPSTGMPTWTDQSDLRFVIHASQGEFIKLVFTPGDIEEAYELTLLAFKLSEKYHIPIIILSDKFLAEGTWSSLLNTEVIDNSSRAGFLSSTALLRIEKFERYIDTTSGISPRSIPGMQKGEYLANSDEHDFYGYSDESKEMRDIQMTKRISKKLIRLTKELPEHVIMGDLSSSFGVITFGSMKNQMLEVLKENKKIKYISLKYINPFPIDIINEFLNSCNKFIVIENNYSAQLAGLITQHTGKFPYKTLLKDDGRPIYYEDILTFLNEYGNF